eukprot:GHVU01147258.1.p1 GENE.GHVU01147258.1~~GHVU01147258.1.p1  ORF type:complete len:245 (-),score=45.78 GHVU01147258.1:163-897(-)
MAASQEAAGARQANVSNPTFSDMSDEFSVDGSWIQWFAIHKTREFLVEVDVLYIKDSFNLFGLRQRVEDYERALEVILGNDCPEDPTEAEDDDAASPSATEDRRLEKAAEQLYGLIHSRYILTPRGLLLMKNKYQKKMFGTCPRVLCDNQPLLPVGLCDDLMMLGMHTYCSRCQETYTPKAAGPLVGGTGRRAGRRWEGETRGRTRRQQRQEQGGCLPVGEAGAGGRTDCVCRQKGGVKGERER